MMCPFPCDAPFSIFWERKKLDKSEQGAALHAHNIHELYILLHGSTKYFIQDEVFSLCAGEMAFVPKETLHRTEYTINEDIERIVISFTDAFFESDFACYLQEMTESKHISFDRHGLLIIADIIKKIEEERARRTAGDNLMRRLYFQQLLILISRYRKKKETEPCSAPLLLIQNVLNYINQNYTSDITLSVLSKAFSISPSYLSKSFKSVTGLGVKEYLNVTRISAAKTLLDTTDLSIVQVATECGYNDSSYFSSMFKKIIGVTPKRYALIHQGDHTAL